MLMLVLSILTACNQSASTEIEEVRAENEQLKQQLMALETDPTTVTELNTEVEPEDNTEKEIIHNDVVEGTSEGVVFSGSGDKVITNVYVPEGIYIATISVYSDEFYSVKFHLNDDDYISLVIGGGKPYKGVHLLKGYHLDEVVDGMFEVASDGEWEIVLQPLTAKSTTSIVGEGKTI